MLLIFLYGYFVNFVHTLVHVSQWFLVDAISCLIKLVLFALVSYVVYYMYTNIALPFSLVMLLIIHAF